MARYLGTRLGQTIVVLLGISTVVFFTLRLSGDPVLIMVNPQATTMQITQLRHAFGFDRPLTVQYLDFLSHLGRGDFGVSIRHGTSALGLVIERLPATAELAIASLSLAVGIALPVGLLAAAHRGSWTDAFVMVGALFAQSMPGFWLGILLIMVFSVRLGWLPSFGRGSLQNLILPAITLSAFSLARLTRLIRSGLLDVLGQDYIRTARAKGVPRRDVLRKHALRNALLPVVTLIGLDVGFLLGGAVIVETIFAWPGMGQLALQAVYNRDFPLVQANVIFISGLFVLTNLIVDVAYTIIDPRIRYG